MPFDLAYLRQNVLDKLQGDAYFDTAMIDAAINEGIDDLVLFSQVSQDKEAIPVLTGTREVLTIQDWLLVKGAMFDNRALREITYEDFRNIGGEAQVSNGTVGRYYSRNTIAGLMIGLVSPPASDGTLTVVGVMKTPDLVLVTDIPPVARVYTQAIVRYALYQLLENDAGRAAESDRYYQMYIKRRAEATVLLSASTKRTFRRVRPSR
jgi:hypothetical protein